MVFMNLSPGVLLFKQGNINLKKNLIAARPPVAIANRSYNIELFSFRKPITWVAPQKAPAAPATSNIKFIYKPTNTKSDCNDTRGHDDIVSSLQIIAIYINHNTYKRNILYHFIIKM